MRRYLCVGTILLMSVGPAVGAGPEPTRRRPADPVRNAKKAPAKPPAPPAKPAADKPSVAKSAPTAGGRSRLPVDRRPIGSASDPRLDRPLDPSKAPPVTAGDRLGGRGRLSEDEMPGGQAVPKSSVPQGRSGPGGGKSAGGLPDDDPGVVSQPPLGEGGAGGRAQTSNLPRGKGGSGSNSGSKDPGPAGSPPDRSRPDTTGVPDRDRTQKQPDVDSGTYKDRSTDVTRSDGTQKITRQEEHETTNGILIVKTTHETAKDGTVTETEERTKRNNDGTVEHEKSTTKVDKDGNTTRTTGANTNPEYAGERGDRSGAATATRPNKSDGLVHRTDPGSGQRTNTGGIVPGRTAGRDPKKERTGADQLRVEADGSKPTLKGNGLVDPSEPTIGSRPQVEISNPRNGPQNQNGPPR